jgi:hypothetical protein
MTDIMDQYGDRISPEPNSGCWLWTGAITSKPKPYALVKMRGKTYRMNGVIKKLLGLQGDVMRHKCGVTICVNPQHLAAGTQRDNMQDMTQEQRSERVRKANAAKTPEQKSASAHKTWATRRRHV